MPFSFAPAWCPHSPRQEILAPGLKLWRVAPDPHSLRGSWFVLQDPRTLVESPLEFSQRYAIPLNGLPLDKRLSFVGSFLIPRGVRMLLGVASANGFGPGGGQQVQILHPISESWSLSISSWKDPL